jgi:hypothetical protein
MTVTRTPDRRSARRVVTSGAAIAAVALWGAGSALAGELLVVGSKARPELEYFAAKGERNDVHVADTKAGYTLQDLGPTIRKAPRGCRRTADRHKATCSHKVRRSGGPSRKPALLNLVLGDVADHVIVTTSFHLPVLVSADAGDDRVFGGPSGDTIYGKTGDDYLDGRGGRDTISGGDGDDIIVSNDDSRDEVKCGAGTDRVEADHLDKIAKDCERVEA